MNWRELNERIERVVYKGKIIYLTTIKPQDSAEDRLNLHLYIRRRSDHDKEFQNQSRRIHEHRTN